MSSPSPQEKQAVVRQVLQSLAASQPPTVQVRLLARIADGPQGMRGLLNPSAPTLPAAPAVRAEAEGTLMALRIGHELHVDVIAPRNGYLHLFNLGSSGEVRRMLPRPGETPARLTGQHAYRASPAAATPWIEQGPVNGFPERVLAVVTPGSRAVPASCLHPSFSDAAFTRGFSPPVIDALLADWPIADWSWGFGEARVEA